MADPYGDQDQGPGGAGKRPAQTIEGTATEILAEAAAKSEAHAGHEAIGESADRLAGGASDDAEAGAGLPPPAASLSELRGFVTHLAAGLLGGLVGVIALALAWGGLAPGTPEATGPDISALEQRVGKLESAAPNAGDTAALSKLESRIAALEGSSTQTSPELSGLPARVAQLEASLKALAETANEGGSVASAAAINQQIAEAEQRLDAKLAAALADGEAANASVLKTVQSELAELKAKFGALAEAELGTGDPAGVAPELASLTERVGKVEAAVSELAGAVAKEGEGAKSAALAIAFANLRAAVSDGRPFAVELDTIAALAPAVGDLGVLPAYAEKGIPTLPELARSFAVIKEGALTAAAPAAGGSIVDSLMASALSLVKIKRVGEAAAGDGAGPVLARAEAKLDKGDLAAAVKEVETLDGATREAFSVWLGQARARIGADATMTRLEGLLLVSMGGEAQAPQP